MPTKRSGKLKKFLSALTDILVAVLVFLLSQIIATLLLSIFGLDVSETASSLTVLLSYIISGITVISLLILIMRKGRLGKKELGLFRPSMSSMGLASARFLLYLISTVLVSMLITVIFGVDLSQKQDLGLDSVDSWLIALVFLSFVIITPAAEELLFRGLLYRRLRSKFGRVPTALTVSILFAALHGQLNVAIDTFLLSMIIIYTLEKNNNLWLAYFMHVLKNLLAFLVVFVFKWA